MRAVPRTPAFYYLVIALVFALVTPLSSDAAPEGEMTWAVHVALAATWFDPAETSGIQTPFMVLYALHDALVKPMPGNLATASLAESWTASADGLTFDFVLRKGVRFHNGEPVTAEDVKFSFARYRGASSKILKARVLAIETPGPDRVRIRLKQPWPDFTTFYLGNGASWIVPKAYVEKVGDDGFKKAPIGAGPYKFVSFTPGVELVLEAFDGYWRKQPSVRRLVLRTMPDEATRLAALKRGEVDIAYAIWGALGEEVRRTPTLVHTATLVPTMMWIVFADQWDPKSPWHDRRVRLAANQAVDRQAINRAENLGHARISATIIPGNFDFAWQPPAYTYDPERARQLLREAGYPNGFDAGDLYCDVAFANVAEGAVNGLQAVGIRVRLRSLERAAFFSGYSEKKFRNLIQTQSGAFGNAATRIETFVASGGVYTYGGYPDIDALFREQATEMNRNRRETMLHKIQQLMHEKTMFLPIWQLAAMSAVGPRVAESGIGLIQGHVFFSAPYEELKLKAR